MTRALPSLGGLGFRLTKRALGCADCKNRYPNPDVLWKALVALERVGRAYTAMTANDTRPRVMSPPIANRRQEQRPEGEALAQRALRPYLYRPHPNSRPIRCCRPGVAHYRNARYLR